jgi:SH3 domain-containing YSC84-like protein 1
MKKLLTAIFCLTALAITLPASGLTRQDVVKHLDSCEAVLQDIQGNMKTAIPADVLRRAKGLVIVNQFQGSFIFGIKDGYAVAMVRRPNGKWSVPAFLKAGEISLGFQVGAKSVTAVYVLLDDSATSLLLKNRMNFGAEAKAVAGIRAAETQAVTNPLPGDANIYAYSASEGLFVGASIKTGFLSPSEESNQIFYGNKLQLPELLFSDWVTPPPETRFIMDYVTRLTQ